MMPRLRGNHIYIYIYIYIPFLFFYKNKVGGQVSVCKMEEYLFSFDKC